MLTTCIAKMNTPLMEVGDIFTPRYIITYFIPKRLS